MRWQQDKSLSFDECVVLIPPEMRGDENLDGIPEDEWKAGLEILEGLQAAFEKGDFAVIASKMEAMEGGAMDGGCDSAEEQQAVVEEEEQQAVVEEEQQQAVVETTNV